MNIELEKERQEVETLYAILMMSATKFSPRAYSNVLAGVLANVVANLPDEYWEKMKVVTPCDTPDCTCHLPLLKFIDACSTLREEHAKSFRNPARN